MGVKESHSNTHKTAGGSAYPIKLKGAIIFTRMGEPSICDEPSPIFSGPPLTIVKILAPPKEC